MRYLLFLNTSILVVLTMLRRQNLLIVVVSWWIKRIVTAIRNLTIT